MEPSSKSYSVDGGQCMWLVHWYSTSLFEDPDVINFNPEDTRNIFF